MGAVLSVGLCSLVILCTCLSLSELATQLSSLICSPCPLIAFPASAHGTFIHPVSVASQLSADHTDKSDNNAYYII